MFEFHWSAGPFFGFFVLLALAALSFLIWMIVDAAARPVEDYSSPGAKTGWIVGMILGIFFGFGFIVAVVYMFVVRMPSRRRAAARRGPYGTHASYPGPQNVPAPPPPAPAPPPPGSVGAPGASASAYCRNCGAKLVTGSRFCHSCGTPTT